MSIVIGHTERPPTDPTEFADAHPGAVRLRLRKRSRRVPLTARVVPTAYSRWRGWLDRPLAAVLLLPGLPLIAALIVLVRVASPGPGLIRQWRVGRGGKPFRLYKLRTMRCDAETRTGAVWSPTGDPRVTGLGYWIRKLHLDELPQLLNVLRGEMALVGPRPERPEFVAVLQDVVPGYGSRTCVMPGIVGLAQLNLPPDTTLCSVCRKTVLDLDYIRRSGPILDLRILGCGFARMFGIASVRLNRLFGLDCKVRIAGGCRGRSAQARSRPVAPHDVRCPLTERLTQGLDVEDLQRKLHDPMSNSGSNGNGARPKPR